MDAYRQIWFKGKDINSNLWVEGYFCFSNRKPFINVPDDKTNATYIHEIEFSTLCQYTGLVDMNGRKIFESDILRGYDYPLQIKGKDAYYAKVVWFEDAPSFGIQVFKVPINPFANATESYTDYMIDWNSKKWEVIDNAIDNRLNIRYCSSSNDALIKYAILQLGIENKGVFRQYHSTDLQKPKPDEYQLVHIDYARYIEGELTKDFLDKIFHRYSCPTLPEKYKGRCMTSSDIIAITNGKVVNYYYVNSFGFELLLGFHHDATEINLGAREF